MFSMRCEPSVDATETCQRLRAYLPRYNSSFTRFVYIKVFMQMLLRERN